MTHDEALELIPIALVDTLEPVDRARLAAHVAACDTCRAVYEDSARALDAAARALPQIAPPVSLRARVLAQATRPAAPVSVPPAETGPALARSPALRWSWALPLAASLVAAVAVSGWFMTRARLQDAYQTIASLRQALTTSEAARVRAEQEAAGQQLLRAQYQQTIAVLGASDLRQVGLKGLPPAADARARAYLSSAGLLFSAQGLPPLATGRVYQLWLVVGSNAMSAGTFAIGVDGRAQFVVPLPTADPPSALAVTVEPEGGVPSPTGPQYLLGAPTN